MRRLRELRWRVIALWRRLTTSAASRQQWVWLGLDLTLERTPVNGPIGLDWREILRAEYAVNPRRYGVTAADLATPTPRRYFAGFIGDQLVAGMWVFAPPEHVLERFPPLVREAVAPSALMVDGCFTLPAFRGQSIYPAALGWLGAQARTWGVCQLVLQVRAGNRASLRGVAKAGFEMLPR